MPIELREYQKECIDAVEKAGAGNHLVVMATGLGKTVTFANIPRHGRVLILSHRDELVRQPEKYYDCSFGIEKASEHSNGEDVVSATVQTLASDRRLNAFNPGDFDMVITDEAHHAVAPSYRKIIEYLQPRVHLGFTATPERYDGESLFTVYEDLIFNRDLRWGIEQGYLTDIDYRRYTVSWKTDDVRLRNGDYAIGELDKQVNTDKTNQQVLNAYDTLAIGQTLIFAASVNHAHELAKLIERAVVVDAKTPSKDRRDIVRKFTNRKIPCLINYGVFTEGTDIPFVETIILARPTANKGLYSQMVGRGLRLAEGKKTLLLIECAGQSEDPRLFTAPELFGVDVSKVSIKQRYLIDGLLTELPSRLVKVSRKAAKAVVESDRRKLKKTRRHPIRKKLHGFLFPNENRNEKPYPSFVNAGNIQIHPPIPSEDKSSMRFVTRVKLKKLLYGVICGLGKMKPNTAIIERIERTGCLIEPKLAEQQNGSFVNVKNASLEVDGINQAYTVTSRAKSFKQPYGGYLHPSDFKKFTLQDAVELDSDEENVPPGLVGSAVDYLVRYECGVGAVPSFEISFRGAKRLGMAKQFFDLLSQIDDLDNDGTIVAAIKLTGFDCAYRKGRGIYKPVESISPNEATIQNVRTMVRRTLRFFDQCGYPILFDLTFEGGGYTQIVKAGDGDFMTNDTLWDLKTIKGEITTKHTLQVLMYWRMGIHSQYNEYKSVRYLGFFNPRKNIAYKLNVNDIDKNAIDEVDGKVIGYM